jgi:hypothetical protein
VVSEATSQYIYLWTLYSDVHFFFQAKIIQIGRIFPEDNNLEVTWRQNPLPAL